MRHEVLDYGHTEIKAIVVKAETPDHSKPGIGYPL